MFLVKFMIKVFAFLGNHGKDYYNTRHNAGFYCAENLDLTKNISWQNKFDGEYACVTSSNFCESLHFLKPHTFMNASGNSIKKLSKFFKISSDEILVFHDELELETGVLSFKWAGGLGGHNGLRSIKANLGTAEFWRLRIGIDRPKYENANIANYVLSKFAKSELEILNSQLPKLNSLINEIIYCETNDELKRLLLQWRKVKPE